MTTPIFTGFLRAVGTSTDVEGRKILLFWITAPLIHKIHHCVLYTKLHKHILYLDWTRLDTEKNVNTSSRAVADNEIATHGVSTMESCVTIVGMAAAVAMRRKR
jgi:hypothetical protein